MARIKNITVPDDFEYKGKSFPVEIEWEEYFNRISNDRDRGQMIMALFKYARTGEPTTFNDDLLDTMFSFMAKRITQYNEWNRKMRYSAVCKENRRKERRERKMQGKE